MPLNSITKRKYISYTVDITSSHTTDFLPSINFGKDKFITLN